MDFVFDLNCGNFDEPSFQFSLKNQLQPPVFSL